MKAHTREAKFWRALALGQVDDLPEIINEKEYYMKLYALKLMGGDGSTVIYRSVSKPCPAQPAAPENQQYADQFLNDSHIHSSLPCIILCNAYTIVF